MSRPGHRDNYRPGGHPRDYDNRRRDDRYYDNYNGDYGHHRRNPGPQSYRGQPPLPRGPPPGPPLPSYDDRQHPPPRRDYHSSYPAHSRSMQGPPPSRQQDMFRFRGQAAQRSAPLNYDSSPRHSDEDNYRPDRYSHDSRNHFDFRAPQSAPDAPSFPPEQHHQYPHQVRADGYRGRGPRARGGYRGGFRGPPQASERPLLRAYRETTPEQLTGMNDGPSKFTIAGSSSGSESGVGKSRPDPSSGDIDADHDDTAEPLSKRAKTAHIELADQGTPKWSNADAYSTVMPADDATHKPKNLLGMIRKAKVDAQRNTKPVVAADDFISLSFDNDGTSAAPAPKPSFSHLDNLHPNRTAPAEPDAASAPAPAPAPAPAIPTLPQISAKRKIPDDVISISSDDSTASIFLEKQTKKASEVPIVSNKRKYDQVRDRHILDDIAHGWRALPGGRDATPWLSDSPDQGDPEFWLHKEIKLWYDFARPHDFEERERLRLIERIQTAVRTVFPHVQIDSFGSFASKLYLPVADMDLVARSKSFINGRAPSIGQSRAQMNKFADTLAKARIIAPGTRVVIPKARVPIIKFKDQLTGIRVDISFENNSGIVANGTLSAWKERFPAMPWIVLLIKQFLAVRNLHEVHTGGLGGFSIICLVCCTLAKLEREHDPEWDALAHLDEVLLSLFEWFGYDFDVGKHALDMTTFQQVPRSTYRGQVRSNIHRLLIIDPNNKENDVSGGTSRFNDIFKLFRVAYNALTARMDDFSESWTSQKSTTYSILGCVWAANYDMFREQRSRLERIDKTQIVKPPGQQPTNASRTTSNGTTTPVQPAKKASVVPAQAPVSAPTKKSKSKEKNKAVSQAQPPSKKAKKNVDVGKPQEGPPSKKAKKNVEVGKPQEGPPSKKAKNNVDVGSQQDGPPSKKAKKQGDSGSQQVAQEQAGTPADEGRTLRSGKVLYDNPDTETWAMAQRGSSAKDDLPVNSQGLFSKVSSSQATETAKMPQKQKEGKKAKKKRKQEEKRKRKQEEASEGGQKRKIQKVDMQVKLGEAHQVTDKARRLWMDREYQSTGQPSLISRQMVAQVEACVPSLKGKIGEGISKEQRNRYLEDARAQGIGVELTKAKRRRVLAEDKVRQKQDFQALVEAKAQVEQQA